MRNLLLTLTLVGAGAVGCSEPSGESAPAGSGGQQAGAGGAPGPNGGALTSGTGGAGQGGAASGSGGTTSAGGAGGASTGGAPRGGTAGVPSGGAAGVTSTGGTPSSGAAGVTSGGAAGSGGRSGGAGGASGGGAGGPACPAVNPDACSAADKTICTNEIAMHCGLTYEFWRDTGGGCMVAKAAGFSIEWNENNNVLARKGVRPGTGNEVFHYEADYTADGTSFMGVYGWTQNPLIEYYIVDSWGGSRPPGSRGEHVGSVEADGGVYDMYRTQQVDKPSIDPNVTTFYQYWSVRTSKRSCGTISVRQHFDAWAQADLTLGRFYEVSFVVEGYLSTGSGDVRLSVD